MWQERLKEWPIPGDHSRQVDSYALVKKVILQSNDIKKLMDLGCGAGDSVDLFKCLIPDVHWVGLDVESSPEVSTRTRNDAEFHSFDGITIPFGDGSFDLIFSNQVFEHVRHPDRLLKEVCRVLKQGGYLVGSTSQLELYHSFSLWNYTPYGFLILVEGGGLRILEVRPGIDFLTLMLRVVLREPKCFSRWFARESPLNRLIGLGGGFLGRSHKEINFAKLIFCGHFCFMAQKP